LPESADNPERRQDYFRIATAEKMITGFFQVFLDFLKIINLSGDGEPTTSLAGRPGDSRRAGKCRP
jgi:hypothetical protein